MEAREYHDQKRREKSDTEWSNGGRAEGVKGKAQTWQNGKEQEKIGKDTESREATFNPKTPADSLGFTLHYTTCKNIYTQIF